MSPQFISIYGSIPGKKTSVAFKVDLLILKKNAAFSETKERNRHLSASVSNVKYSQVVPI